MITNKPVNLVALFEDKQVNFGLYKKQYLHDYFLLKITINETPNGIFTLGLSKAFSAINIP